MAKKVGPDISPKMLAAIEKVTAKRPRVVLDHILKHGVITTEDLQAYGYEHPPRAIRDVREHGIPLVTTRVQGKNGKSIGAYQLGDPAQLEANKMGGRNVLSKHLLKALYLGNGGRCDACGFRYEERYLQVDHRIPYEVAGDQAASAIEFAGESVPDAADKTFMLLCGTCQRKKSWSCENCPNWAAKNPDTCASCYWGNPAKHSHIATTQVRRVDLVFHGEDVASFDEWTREANARGLSLQDYLKSRLCSR